MSGATRTTAPGGAGAANFAGNTFLRFAATSGPLNDTMNAGFGSPIKGAREERQVVPRMMRHRILFILLGLLVTAGHVRAEDMVVENFRRIMAQQKAQRQEYVQRMRELPGGGGGTRTIDQILQIRTEHGKLQLTSPLFGESDRLQNMQFRAAVTGFDEPVTLTVQQIARTGQYYFTLTNTSYPNLDRMSNLSVQMRPDSLLIAKNTTMPRRNEAVSFVQSEGRGMFGQVDGVQLTVYASSNTGRMERNVVLLEQDFATLLRKHPREVDQYLRPMMRELRQDSLFAVDDLTAWQVFSDKWKPNAAVASEVTRLLPELDQEDYATREAARQSLLKLGPDAAMVIYRMKRDGLSPEQRCQLDALLTHHSFLSRAEAQRLATDSDFLLDCLYSPNTQIRQIAADRLGEKLNHPVTVDASADYPARVRQVDALRAEIGKGAKG